MATKLDDTTSDIRRFTMQKAIRIRTAEGRSASTSAQEAAAVALKARYANNGPKASRPATSG